VPCEVTRVVRTSVDQQVRDTVKGIAHADEENLGRFVGSVLSASGHPFQPALINDILDIIVPQIPRQFLRRSRPVFILVFVFSSYLHILSKES
jgi:hypothetical protein